jgi:Bacterial Ig domain
VPISSAADGAVASGTLGVTVSASDDVGVVKVKFYIDGRLFAADTLETFSFTWDTIQTPGAQYILQANAYDGGWRCLNDRY